MSMLMSKNPEIVSLLAVAKQCKDGAYGILSLVERIISILIDEGLAVKIQLAPKAVGVHPSNRYGFGINAHNMHRLLLNIFNLGWSWAACSMAFCVEDGPSKSIATFTIDMQNTSPLFGHSLYYEIVAGSLTCGHTNQSLVAAIDGANCDHTAISVDGHISTEKIKSKHGFGEAMTNGSIWTMLKHQSVQLYPDLPNLIQRAFQGAGQVQNEETHFEQQQRGDAALPQAAPQ